MELSNEKGCVEMLPCSQTCSHYCPGCHKACPQWEKLQKQQTIQRKQKKAYLKYYGELCAIRTQQFSSLSPTQW